jgi:alpha-L-fucosidase
MQYAVLTAKHHDGYAMFATEQSGHSTMHSPGGRDIVREFVEAMRAEGIRVGLYFSLIDWHHPDYPAFTQADQPYRWGAWRQPDPAQWARFIDFMFAQVRELLTNYGCIDVLWFDGGWERTPEQWKARELFDMVRQLQPDILINDRLPGFGDFSTPEQFVPPQQLPKPWEVCLTINESWGYNPADKHFKSPRQLIHTLCEIAGKGGNLLLNVSPMGDGRLQPELVERLAVIEQWMSKNGESIVGTTPALEPWQFYGPSTRRGDRVYLHLLMRPYETVSVRGLHIKRVRSVRALSTGGELPFTSRCSIVDQMLNPDPQGELTITVPESALDPYATVLAIDLADGPV